jgi:hypothetical protein
MDRFSREFLKQVRVKWKEPYESECFRTTLHHAALATRLDIAGIQCKHALIRRLARADQSSWKRSVFGVSADFVVAQQRVAERGRHRNDSFMSDNMSSGGKTKSRNHPPKVCRVGGVGGGQREFLSRYLRQHQKGKLSSDEKAALFKAATEEYSNQKAASGIEHDKALERGRAATQSHRAGARSFGPTQKQLQPAERAATQAALAAFRQSSTGSPVLICSLIFRCPLVWNTFN